MRPAWLEIARERRVIARACLAAIFVGAVLSLLDHGGEIWSGSGSAVIAAQVAASFLVPFAVSMVLSVAAIGGRRDRLLHDQVLLGREIEAINRFPDQNPNPVLRVSDAGRLVYANAASEGIAQALGATTGAPLAPTEAARLQEAARAGRPVEIATGNRIYELKAVHVEDLGFMNVYGTDVTAARAITKFPDQNPNPVLRMTPDGRLAYANRAAADIREWLGCEVGGRVRDDFLAEVREALNQDGATVELTANERVFELLAVEVFGFDFVNLYGTDVTAARLVAVTGAENERLLLNILPATIARRLRQGEAPIADRLDALSVLFADIVDFTTMSSVMAPHEVLALLNDVFSIFDRLADQYGLEKVKTIGDAYMVVGGLQRGGGELSQVAEMALDMLAELDRYRRETGRAVHIRAGLHTGPAVAGVIGLKKFIYDVWGDTVNMASRMESLGAPDRIQVTDGTRALLAREFTFAERGVVEVKGKGPTLTHYLTGRAAVPSPTS